MLVLAMDGKRAIAGALNMIGSDTLYGRYWGRVVDRPFLHFEVCYYQAIDFAIERGLSRVEAGAQGEHKLARGYEPQLTRSAHWIAHPGLRDAVARYLDSEREAVEEGIDHLAAFSPFRKGETPTTPESDPRLDEEGF
jgi:predicted N-acyltransferase